MLPGVSSIAVPLRLPQGEPAAIAVLYLPRPLDQEHVAEVLIAAAKRIGAALR